MHRVQRFVLILVLAFAWVGHVAANTPAVRRLPNLHGWVIETNRSTYILARNEEGGVQQVYWGGRLDDPENLTVAHFPRTLAGLTFTAGHREEIRGEEYPGWGGARFEEPCLKATWADGVRDLRLVYVSDEVSADALAIVMKDEKYGLRLRLCYHVYPHEGIIAKWSEISNEGRTPVTLESAQSGVWLLPADRNYRLTYLAGHWGGEAKVVHEPLDQGMKVIESRRGTTGFESNPWFAIDANGDATEESGRVWFGALAWSGNWRIAIESNYRGQPRVTGGYNPFDFGYLLNPGDTLSTPRFYGGYTDKGFGEASRMLHDLERNDIRPGGSSARLRPVWYNSWQVYETAVTEENQKALARKAAELGVELFVVDDGWFHLRKATAAGLGDWYPDPDKFPHGLKPLADYVNRLGMDFGLWVEPEMVSPNSDLYRRHSDWVLNFLGRPRTEGRGQLVLNLARDDVREYLFGALDALVTENNIKLFKWDMNRLITDPGWPQLPPAEQQRVWVKYTQNLYNIIDRLRAKHPGLEFESCKGGGGRIDLGILQRVDQFWTSDNTDAVDRIWIQQGFSFAYAPQFLMGRVPPAYNNHGKPNVRPNTPLEFRFIVAMMGSMGMSLNLNELSPPEQQQTAQLIKYYKTIRNTTQTGRLYRLAALRDGELAANEFVGTDGRQTVLFALMPRQDFYTEFHQPVRLQGLDPDATYTVNALHRDMLLTQITSATGAYLMQQGLLFTFPQQDYEANVVVLERQGR